MTNNRKAQSALEFLMTYGWAILVVLAAIGALAYFGVLNPSNFLPDQCTASVGMGCIGKPAITPGQALFTLVNGLGTTITLNNATTTKMTGCTSIRVCDKGGSANCQTSRAVVDGDTVTINATCSATTFALGNSVKGSFVFTYADGQSGLPQKLTVQLSGKVR